MIRLNRQYAERFGDAWVVFSAKYGFIVPDSQIPGSCEVAFKRPTTNPIAIYQLRRQVQNQGLDRYSDIVGLGRKEYCAAIQAAFAGAPVRVAFPFAGLPIGKLMQATKRAIATDRPGF